MSKTSLLPAAAFACLPGLAAAQFEEKDFRGLGPSVGLYYPAGKIVKDAFGTQVFSFGFGPVDANVPTKGRIRSGINVVSAHKTGNKMFILPITAIYEKGLSESLTHRPYFKVGAGVAYYDYSFSSGGSKYSNKALGPTGFAEIGMNIAGRLNLYGRYNVFGQKDGIDFNGLSFGVSYSVLKL